MERRPDLTNYIGAFLGQQRGRGRSPCPGDFDAVAFPPPPPQYKVKIKNRKWKGEGEGGEGGGGGWENRGKLMFSLTVGGGLRWWAGGWSACLVNGLSPGMLD